MQKKAVIILALERGVSNRLHSNIGAKVGECKKEGMATSKLIPTCFGVSIVHN